MSDTFTENGTHDAHDHDGGTFDTAGALDNMDAVERAARAEVTKRQANVDRLLAERAKLDDVLAVERAHIARCNRILGIAEADVKPRRKATAKQPTAKGKR